MSTKTLVAPVPNGIEAPPLVRGLRQIVLRLLGHVRGGVRHADRVLAVEDRVVLGPKKSLVVVRCHGQHFLVAVSADAVGPMIEVARPKVARKNPTAMARRTGQERGA
jgi:flagellar biogenesis protein FliO